jgi:hypothetical protein
MNTKITTFIQVLKSINIFYCYKFVKLHYKTNPSKCICTNIGKIRNFQQFMHIILNAPFESDYLGKESGGNDILTYGEKRAQGERG